MDQIEDTYLKHREYTFSKCTLNIIRNNTYQTNKKVSKYSMDFPGGPVVKNLPSNAGDVGLITARRTKIPHATGQLSPRATTSESTRPGACAPQLEDKTHTPQLERSPHAATKSPHTATKHSACHS